MILRTGKGPSGLTLVEVLVSIVILSTGAVLVVQGLARVSYAQMVAEQRTHAYLFALSKMAELEMAMQEGPLAEHDDGSFRIGEQAFHWEVTSAEVAGAEEARAVSLEVAWHHGADVFEHRVDTVLRAPAALHPS